MQHHLHHLLQHQGAFYSDYSTWFFDYQAVTHTVQTQKAKKGRGPKNQDQTCFVFVFVPEHRKLAFSNTGLSFRRISGTGSNCPQQHDAHLLLNKLRKTRQNTVGETKTTAFWRLLLQPVLTARKQYIVVPRFLVFTSLTVRLMPLYKALCEDLGF